MQHDLDELKDEVWRQAGVLKERMEALERSQSNTALRILESITQKHSATLSKIEEVAESRSTSSEERSYSDDDHSGRRYEEKREDRAQRNQNSMSKHQLEELLHECERELQEMDRFLQNKKVRASVWGPEYEEQRVLYDVCVL
ncbi:hypothetical protein Y032_0609g619 [Ancylostoma ceylanicum]|uniref:Uncharacterized protein n=1 Tax=Ancylostoma ceylanicum TaxID=53326 RepID=A0A016WLK9_9BILA|nr:hypothetical protein Y032_0609g619 [Ancylostoma ceylanicum]